MRPRKYPQKRRTLLDLWDKNSLLDLPYVSFGFGIQFGYLGIYVVFFDIRLYSMSRADVNAHLAFSLLALINAGSSLGRFLPNFAADYVGTLNMQTPFVFASAVPSLSLIAIKTYLASLPSASYTDSSPAHLSVCQLQLLRACRRMWQH